MERQRPDYLEPIPRTRWEFPWLGLWAVLLPGMAGAGIWLHLKTGDAWNTRFKGATAPSAAAAPIEASTAEIDPSRQVPIAEIRARREQAEREILQHRAGIAASAALRSGAYRVDGRTFLARNARDASR